MDTIEFKCPRRAELGSGEQQKVFTLLDGSDHWRLDFTCSWCGSLHPDRFINAVEKGVMVTPTDKNYKAYIDLNDPDVMEAYKLILAEQKIKDEQFMKDHPNITIISNDPNKVEKRMYKFYYQHLSEEQKARFITAYNNKVMKINYPGNFYVMPFFCERTDNMDQGG